MAPSLRQLAAAPQVPGWAVGIINVYESVSASGNVAAAREVTIGNLHPNVNVNLNVNIGARPDLVLVAPTYAFATPESWDVLSDVLARVATDADDPDASKKEGKVCEANFFSGELALRKGSKEEAAHLFRLASDDCPKDYDQWFAAKQELKALGVAP